MTRTEILLEEKTRKPTTEECRDCKIYTAYFAPGWHGYNNCIVWLCNTGECPVDKGKPIMNKN